jgi:nitrite reductase (NO-forming)
MQSHKSSTRLPRFGLSRGLRTRWILLSATAVALVLALVAVVAYAFAGGFDPITNEHAGGGGTRVVRVELVDVSLGFDVAPDVITVDPGTHLVLDVVNEGKEVHNLALNGGLPRTRMLEPGESQRLDIGTVSRDLGSWCTLPGQKLFGMALEIHVVRGS